MIHGINVEIVYDNVEPYFQNLQPMYDVGVDMPFDALNIKNGVRTIGHAFAIGYLVKYM